MRHGESLVVSFDKGQVENFKTPPTKSIVRLVHNSSILLK
jgi:hypothetical protein